MHNQETIEKLIRQRKVEKQLHYNDSSLNCTNCGESECNNPNNCAFAKTAQREATSPNCVISYVLRAGTSSITEENTVEPLPIQQSVKLVEFKGRAQKLAQVKARTVLGEDLAVSHLELHVHL